MFVSAHGEFVAQAFVSRMGRKWLFRQCGYWGVADCFCSDEFAEIEIRVSRRGALASVWSWADCKRNTVC